VPRSQGRGYCPPVEVQASRHPSGGCRGPGRSSPRVQGPLADRPHARITVQRLSPAASASGTPEVSFSAAVPEPQAAAAGEDHHERIDGVYDRLEHRRPDSLPIGCKRRLLCRGPGCTTEHSRTERCRHDGEWYRSSGPDSTVKGGISWQPAPGGRRVQSQPTGCIPRRRARRAPRTSGFCPAAESPPAAGRGVGRDLRSAPSPVCM
jgi:hypothetical protein